MELSLLQEAGIDVQSALHRFMNNEQMFLKHLRKFLDNTLFDGFLVEIEADQIQVETAFDRGHALKGVCANLSMEAVLAILDPMVETLRAGSTQGIKEQIPALKEAYDKTISGIRNFE